MADRSIDVQADRVRAAELLSEVVTLAEKAENTSQKVRAFLGAAQAYSKFDKIIAFEVLRTAVKAINSQSGDDFEETYFIRRIAGTHFSHNAILRVEGFSLERAFRALGAYDFTGVMGDN